MECERKGVSVQAKGRDLEAMQGSFKALLGFLAGRRMAAFTQWSCMV